MTGRKVGVKMGQHHFFDGQSLAFSVLQILVHIALRVDHDGSARFRVRDHVRGVGQATQIILLNFHPAQST